VSDEAARRRFRHLVLPWLDDAFRLARWLTGNRQDAEDVVQEAMLRAFAAIGTCSGSNARAWVLTIVRRTAYTWLAKNRPAMLVLTDDLEAAERRGGASGPEDSYPTPEAILLAAEDEERLARAIAALPAPFRETLVLRDLEGLSYREISEVLDIPVGTVMSRLARARSQLIKALGGAGHD
jgi:RNA polymerase sigma factor (sigma-70 family)